MKILKNLKDHTPSEDNYKLRSRHDYNYFMIVVMFYAQYRELVKTKPNQSDWKKSLEQLVLEMKEVDETDTPDIDSGVAIQYVTTLRTTSDIMVVFSCMCLEAIINDFCTIKKSLSY